MLVELDKKDLISLVKGREPSFEQMDHPLVKANGKYWGGFNDKWEWNSSAFSDNTEEEVYSCYIYLKQAPVKPESQYDKDVKVIQEVLADGIARRNHVQIQAAMDELERLHKEKI